MEIVLDLLLIPCINMYEKKKLQNILVYFINISLQPTSQLAEMCYDDYDDDFINISLF